MATKYSFRDFLDEVADLTDSNAHSESIQAICEYFGYDKYNEIMGHIIAIQDIERSLPQQLGEYRTSVMNEVLDLVKKNEGSEIYQAVYDCL